jgi:transposase
MEIQAEAIPAYVFVAVLTCSGYAYVRAYLSQDQESWIDAHINIFNFSGGVTRIIVTDNLKTGVQKSDWYSPVINKSYQEMAEHYGSAIIHARVRRPKDKASVEDTVGVISTWIIAALRNGKYFSLNDLNEAISKKLKSFNEKEFQKKPGSRYIAFIDDEKEYLMPLPVNQYELEVWKSLIPGFNYHVSVDKNFYSVPYEYIKHEMDVRITRSIVEVFYNNHRICSHPRLYGRAGQYHTIPEHMPENIRAILSGMQRGSFLGQTL